MKRSRVWFHKWWRRYLESGPKVTFIRLVSAQGTARVLGQSFKVGKRLKFQYVKVTIYTKYQKLKVYSKGKLIKAFSYPLPKR